MKSNKMHTLGLLTAVATLTWVSAGLAAPNDPAGDLPQNVAIELGDTQFAPGDSLTILKVHGTSDQITVGGTYCVEGTYTLSSRDAARLSLFTTAVMDSSPSPESPGQTIKIDKGVLTQSNGAWTLSASRISVSVDPAQTVQITKGTGTFRLTTTMKTEGYLHLSFYPLTSGGWFGVVYFGQGKWVLHDGKYSQAARPATSIYQGERRDMPGNHAPLSAPNLAMLDYLGNPVETPADLAAVYTPGGLTEAIQTAARQAGVTIAKIEPEASEFPCLIGVCCAGTDYAKLMAQIKLMNDYEDQGSVGGNDWHTMNIVPWRVFPRESSERIQRRLTLREQIFYDKLSR